MNTSMGKTSDGSQRRAARFVAPAVFAVVGVVAVLVALRSLGRFGQEDSTSSRESPTPVRAIERTDTAVPLEVPTGLRIEAGARSKDFSARLRRLETSSGAHLLEVVKRGMDPSASWDEKILAMEAMKACRGYVHPRVITASLFENVPSKRDRLQLESDILARLKRCDSLMEIPRAAFDDATQQLTAQLSGIDSPISTPVLRAPTGGTPSQSQIDDARLKIRQGFETYGAAALQWFGPSLFDLSVLEGPLRQRILLLGANSAQIFAAASAIAQCSLDGPCQSTSTIFTAACPSGTNCDGENTAAILAQLPDEGARHRSTELARELTAAIQLGDWKRLGL